MTIFHFHQWINWKPVERVRADGSTKIDKVPWSYSLNQEINHLTPANQMPFEQAKAGGHPVGFVFTARDPYFFLDLDKCRQGSGWIAEAGQICGFFQSAAKEISVSGNGIHIIGQCNKLALHDRRHKWGKEFRPDLGNWLEFYTVDRFMALGHGFEGNFELDWTAALLQWIPQRTAGDDVDLTDGPVPTYTGPRDDDELIARARQSAGSIGQVFGSKATFETLWTARADMLAQHYPSPSGDVWDRSAADQALMAHLAFWTGKDAARMDRLYRRSGLMRDKYKNRPAYAQETIGKAIAACQKVYDYVKPQGAPQAAPDTVRTDGFLTIPQQQEYFGGCVYVMDQNRIRTPKGMMKSEQFNAYFGGYHFVMSGDGSEHTKKAWEAFTENRAHKFPKVTGTCFKPLAEPGAIIDDRVNVYEPFEPIRKPGDPSPFLNHVARMLPVADDRAKVFAYLARAAQSPGIKLQWAPVIQGVEGNGKTIITEVMEYAVGLHYSHRPSAQDLANPFNAYLENKIFIAVEEVHLDGRRELLDVLKPLITNARIEIQPKGIDKRMIDNWANWLFLTNHPDAVVKTRNDRRYAIFYCAQQDSAGLIRDGMGGDYFPNLYRWLRADGKAIVADWLLSYPIPVEFDPAITLHRAPDTSSTELAIRQSLGRIEQEILEMVDQEAKGFAGGWLSSYRVEVLCRENHLRVSRNRLSEIITALGYVQVERSRRPLMSEDLKRPTLYCKASMWRASLETADYCAAQGYPEHFRGASVPYPPVAANAR